MEKKSFSYRKVYERYFLPKIDDTLGMTKMEMFMIRQNYTVPSSNFGILNQSYEIWLVSQLLAYLIIFISFIVSNM